MSDRVCFLCPDCGESAYASVGAYRGNGGSYFTPPEPDEIREIREYDFDCGCDLRHGQQSSDREDMVNPATLSPADIEWWEKVEALVFEGEIEWDDDFVEDFYDDDDPPEPWDLDDDFPFTEAL